MKKIIKSYLLLIIILYISFDGDSQIFNLTNYDTTFFKIISKMEAYYSDTLKKNSENELALEDIKEDVFKSWCWFWRNRVDKLGGFSKYGEQMYDQVKHYQRNNLKSISSISWTPIGPTSDP